MSLAKLKKRLGTPRQLALTAAMVVIGLAMWNFGGRYLMLTMRPDVRSAGPVPPTARLAEVTWQEAVASSGRLYKLGPLEIRLPIHAIVPEESCCHGIVGMGFSIGYSDDPFTYDDDEFWKSFSAVDPTDPAPPEYQRVRYVAQADSLPFFEVYFSGVEKFINIVGLKLFYDHYYSTRFDRRLLIECDDRYTHAELWDKTNLGDSIAWMAVWDTNGDAHGINVKAADPALRDAIYESIVCSFNPAN